MNICSNFESLSGWYASFGHILSVKAKGPPTLWACARWARSEIHPCCVEKWISQNRRTYTSTSVTSVRLFGTTGRVSLPYQLMAIIIKLNLTKSLQVQRWLPTAQETSASLDDVISPLLSEETAIQPNVVSPGRIQVICHWPQMLMKPRCGTRLVPPGPAPLSFVVTAIQYPEYRCLFWLSR